MYVILSVNVFSILKSYKDCFKYENVGLFLFQHD